MESDGLLDTVSINRLSIVQQKNERKLRLLQWNPKANKTDEENSDEEDETDEIMPAKKVTKG